MQHKRSLRVAELLKEEISRIIFKEIKDPWVGFVTITKVKVTDDLKLAKVYLSVIGNDDARTKSLQGLERAKNFIRAGIRSTAGLRYTPELRFYYDDTLDYAEKIDNLLKKIKEE